MIKKRQKQIHEEHGTYPEAKSNIGNVYQWDYASISNVVHIFISNSLHMEVNTLDVNHSTSPPWINTHALAVVVYTRENTNK